MFDHQPAANWRRYLPRTYRKRTVRIEKAKVGDTIRIDSYWAGGSIDYYTLYRNNVAESVASSNHGIGNYDPNDRLVLQAGDVLVRTGVFCGRTSEATITLVEALPAVPA